jgi:hypothetical protein
LRTWNKALLQFLALAVAAVPCAAQSFGIGGSVGLIADLDREFSFQHSEVTGWIDYTMDKNVVFRGTYGSMRAQQYNSQTIVSTPEGSETLPEFKERINYGTVGVSYLFWEGFYTSGIFAGLGVYGIRPDTLPPDIAQYQDQDETVFGWHAGVDGEFRVMKNLAIVLRLTYHNISAHPHREFLNADGGLVVRF